MKSRYDLMKQSEVKDAHGNNYPDVLTLNIGKPYFNNPLRKTEVTQQYVTKPYMLTYDEYGICYFDDILYWLNGVSYPFEMQVGETLHIPSFADLNKFYSDRLVTSR